MISERQTKQTPLRGEASRRQDKLIIVGTPLAKVLADRLVIRQLVALSPADGVQMPWYVAATMMRRDA
jgi:hypothetical protein